MGEDFIIEDIPVFEEPEILDISIEGTEQPDAPEGGDSNILFTTQDDTVGDFSIEEPYEDIYVTSDINNDTSSENNIEFEVVQIETEYVQPQTENIEISENNNQIQPDQSVTPVKIEEITENTTSAVEDNESELLSTLKDIKTLLVENSKEVSTEETTLAEIHEIAVEESTEGTTIDWYSYIEDNKEYQSELLYEINECNKELKEIKNYDSFIFASIAMIVGILVVFVLFSKIKV